MRTVSADEISNAVAAACREAACELPRDVSDAIEAARGVEESEIGRYALSKIVENIELASAEWLPLCQDTGLVVVLADVGQDVHIEGATFEEAINQGVAQGYEEGYLRKSVVGDPLFERVNTRTNAPAIVHTRLVEGDQIVLDILPKGAGSENMSKLAMLKPTATPQDVAQAVVEAIAEAGGNPCPPTIVGVGIGGNAETALLLSKRALLREVGQRNEAEPYARLEEDIVEQANGLGIGPQGFGGTQTVLDVHIEAAPTHIAMLPVGITINCHAARHVRVVL